jgi:hypothetical protein
MLNPDETPLPLTDGRVAAELFRREIKFGPSSDRGALAMFGDDLSPTVMIGFKVEGDDDFPILAVRSFTAERLNPEQAIRAIATTNAWNAGHRFPTALVASGPQESATIATQVQLPAPAGFTDPQLHDAIGIAIAATLQFWNEYHAAESEAREEGAA